MSGVTVHLKASKKKTLDEICEKFDQIEGVEPISKSVRNINDVEIWTIAYEKFYFRTATYTSATIALTEFGDEQTASVISSGGGDGMLNLSYGSNRNLAKAFVEALTSCGFEVVKSDLEEEEETIFNRIFK